MQAPATGRKRRKADSDLSEGRSQRPEGYHKVLDGRKRPVRGLWRRNDRFYARLAVTDRETGRTEVRRVPLTEITPAMINAFIALRQARGWSGRTVNLAVTVLRNVLNRAIDEGWIRDLPTRNLRPLKWTPRKRRLFSFEEIERLCASALAPRYR